MSSFEDVLNKDNLCTIHHQNIQSLATEIYKTLNNLPGGNFEGLFTVKTDSYSPCSEEELIIPKVNAILKRKTSLRYFGGIIWNSTPSGIKNTDSYNNFILKLRKKSRKSMEIMPRLFTKLRNSYYNFLVVRYFKILDIISF